MHQTWRTSSLHPQNHTVRAHHRIPHSTYYCRRDAPLAQKNSAVQQASPDILRDSSQVQQALPAAQLESSVILRDSSPVQ